LGQGLLGSALVSRWRDVADLSTWRTQDIEKFIRANRTARSNMLKPFGLVVNCAVIKKGMHAHRIEPSSVLVNSLLPLTLAESINIDHCLLIHFSTDQFGLDGWENGYAIEKTIGDILLNNTPSIIFRGAFFSLQPNTGGLVDYVKTSQHGEILPGYVNVYSRAIDIESLLISIDELLVEQNLKPMIIGYGTDQKYRKYQLIKDVLNEIGFEENVVPTSKFLLAGRGKQIFLRDFENSSLDRFIEHSYESLVSKVVHTIKNERPALK